ncbi:hypothetical protein [Mucilaginibacter lacusdianchii]|uniref:hypothetical protein n=1 Tax=Mucilaginibacter lacusdianchii TaxID=2684211 RepID=UPI00131EB69F|nr:hypothetical protein [Mucilaginibacter sp. JXJ CY 39]
MKILTKLILCVILITVLSSCATTFDMIKGVNTSALQIGMSKAQVQEALKKKPWGTVSARRDPNTSATLEVVEYAQSDGEKRIDRYWLYFVNDKLDRWEPASKYYEPSL